MAKAAKPTEVNPYRPNGWGMISTIVMKSMDKGQFPLCLLGILLAIIFWRIPSTDLAQLFHEIILLFKTLYLLGWFLAVCVTVTSIYLAAKARKLHKEELAELRNKYENASHQNQKIKV